MMSAVVEIIWQMPGEAPAFARCHPIQIEIARRTILRASSFHNVSLGHSVSPLDPSQDFQADGGARQFGPAAPADQSAAIDAIFGPDNGVIKVIDLFGMAACMQLQCGTETFRLILDGEQGFRELDHQARLPAWALAGARRT